MQKIDFQTYWNTLTALKNPKGTPIIERRETVEKLWKLGADLKGLVHLFSYQDGGYTISDFQRVVDLKDNEGNDILDSSNAFFDFMKIKGRVDDAEAVAQISDSEGKTIYRLERNRMGNFDGFEAITDLLKVGGNAQRVRELSEILDDNGVSVFRTPRDITRFVEHGGKADYVRKLIQLRDQQGKHIFNEFTISLFREHGGTINYASALTKIVDTKGQTVFSNGEDVQDFHLQDTEWVGRKTKHIHRKIKTAYDFVSIRDTKGQTVFRDGRDITDFLKAKGTLKEAKEYVAIQDQHGKTYFRGDEITLLRKNKVPFEYAQRLSKQGLNAATIMYHYKMGLREEDIDFKNSGKPKALILYPTSDPVQMVFQAFSEEDTFKFFRIIQDNYDVRLRAISAVEEMYQELDEAPELALLILGGHGTKTTLTFGASIPKYNVSIDEDSAKLSTARTDLGDHLQCLSPSAVIFLDSCCNGEGRDSEMNMANYVVENASGRKVIAGTDTFNAGKITVNRVFPLDLRLMACYTYADCTYVAQK